jgi:hypothetical protein
METFLSSPASRHLSAKALLDLSSSVSRRSLIFGTKGNAEQIAADVAAAKSSRRTSPRLARNQVQSFDLTETDSPLTSVAAEGRGLFFGNSGSVPYDKPVVFQSIVEMKDETKPRSVYKSIHSLGFVIVLFFISAYLRSMNRHQDQTHHFGLNLTTPDTLVSFSTLEAEKITTSYMHVDENITRTITFPLKTVNISMIRNTIESVQHDVVKPTIKVANGGVSPTAFEIPQAPSKTLSSSQSLQTPSRAIENESIDQVKITAVKTSLPIRDSEGRLVLGRSYISAAGLGEALPPLTAEILMSGEYTTENVRYFISVDISRIRLHPLHSRLCAAISSGQSSSPSFSSCMTASASQLFWATNIGKPGPHKLGIAFLIENMKMDAVSFTTNISIMDMRGKTERVSISVNVSDALEVFPALPSQVPNKKTATISATW